MSSSSERLVNLLGFDPTSRPSLTNPLFKEILGEVEAEREEKARVKAREDIRKAIGLMEQARALEQKFQQEKAKFDKELGKLIDGIERSLKGAAVADEPETETNTQS